MARVTGGVEGARDAAGWSLEQEQKMQGAHPHPAYLVCAPPPTQEDSGHPEELSF